MGKPKITLYVDVISPFAYLGYYMLRHSPVFADVEITYVPVLLGGLMKMCNNRPPIEIKNKDKWINIERLRWARQFNIPMSENVPEGFPKPTLHLQRFMTVLSLSEPTHLAPALDAIYTAIWSPESTVNPRLSVIDPKVFGPYLENSLPSHVVESGLRQFGDDTVKKTLIARTETAFAEGAFGMPWFVCTNAHGETESFWGFDHLGQVTRFMGLASLRPLGQGAVGIGALL